MSGKAEQSITAPSEAVNAAITHLQDRLVHKAFFRAAQKKVKRVRHSASLDGLERMVQSLTDVRVTERPNMLKAGAQSATGIHSLPRTSASPTSSTAVRDRGRRRNTETIIALNHSTKENGSSIFAETGTAWQEQKTSIATLSDEVEKYRKSLVWTRVFCAGDENLTKKKIGMKWTISNGSPKFVKSTERGVYLASLIYLNGRILCTSDDCLPILPIDETITTVSKENHQWLLKMSWCWEDVGELMESDPCQFEDNVSLSFRAKLMNASTSMRSALGLDIGHLYHVPILHDDCVFLTTIRFLNDSEDVQSFALKWVPLHKLLRKKSNSPAICTLVREVVNITSFTRKSSVALKRGLYLGYMKLYSSLNSIHIAVPDSLPSFLPHVHVRDDPKITCEEWQYIKTIGTDSNLIPTTSQAEFHRAISTAIHKLFDELDIDSDIMPGHRLYNAEIIAPNDDVSIILILPRADDVCSAPSAAPRATDSRRHPECINLPLTCFEIVHQSTYQPEFFTTFCRLSIFLEHFIMVSQYERRKCMLENDVLVYNTISERLCEFQKKLDDIWNKARWISRVASEAREKRVRSSVNSTPLSRLIAPVSRMPSDNEKHQKDNQSAEVTEGAEEKCRFSLSYPQQKSHGDIDRLYRRNAADTDAAMESSGSVERSQGDEEKDTAEVIPVYAAYDCGLNDGKPILVSVGKNTTSTEVVRLVLEQISKTSSLPIKDVVDAGKFCLVVVVGTRERRLKDDFALSRMQSPWNKGRLYVRRRSALLAAVQYGNETHV